MVSQRDGQVSWSALFFSQCASNQPFEAVATFELGQAMKQEFWAHSFGAVFAEVSVDPRI
jgi:CxxC motif-containing protein (DUF1111 family)